VPSPCVLILRVFLGIFIKKLASYCKELEMLQKCKKKSDHRFARKKWRIFGGNLFFVAQFIQDFQVVTKITILLL
jgi:hypothetical protein